MTLIVENLQAESDTYLLSSSPTVNFGAQNTLVLGQQAGSKGRGILRFALPTMPATGQLASAVLTLKRASGSYAGTFLAYRVGTLGWISLQATWNNYKTGSAWDAAGGDFDVLTPIVTQVGATDDLPIDVEKTVLACIALGLPNLDLLVAGQEGAINGQFIAHSSRAASAANRPVLAFAYHATAPRATWADDLLTAGDDLLAEALAEDVAARSGGTTATLSLVFDRTAADQEGESKSIANEQALVTVSRSELARLGSPKPRRDLALLPRDDYETDGWFAWTGDVLGQTGTHFVLKFTRPKPFRLGKR
jgi:hypothetical protein